MACACSGVNKTKTQFAWSNGTASKNYDTEVEAQRRKNKDGGTYKPVAA